MVLGFKDRFVDPILAGTKKHTIREDKHDRWKPGRTIHAATGVRTKAYRMFFKARCMSTQSIKIKWNWHYETLGVEGLDQLPRVWVGAVMLDLMQIEALAFNDGFNSVWEFFEWFSSDFEGKIIHWTDYKY